MLKKVEFRLIAVTLAVACASMAAACSPGPAGSAALSGSNGEVVAGDGKRIRIADGKLYVDDAYHGEVPQGASVKYSYEGNASKLTVDGVERRRQ